MAKKCEIRNSTAEFQIFQIEGKEDGVQVAYHNESICCTHKALIQLFDAVVPSVSKHPKIISEGLLRPDSTVSKMVIVGSDT